MITTKRPKFRQRLNGDWELIPDGWNSDHGSGILLILPSFRLWDWSHFPGVFELREVFKPYSDNEVSAEDIEKAITKLWSPKTATIWFCEDLGDPAQSRFGRNPEEAESLVASNRGYARFAQCVYDDYAKPAVELSLPSAAIAAILKLQGD